MASGDVVELWTVSGEPGGVPLDAYDVPAELQDIWRVQCGARDGTQPGRGDPPPRFCGAPGPHVLTGPIAVRGASPGDVLKVEILDATPWVNWGWNSIRKGKGALGHLPAYGAVDETVVVPIDLDRRVAIPPWGHGAEIPLNVTGAGPFFGQMGVAPPKTSGVVSSLAPGPHGGNLDNKRLGPGATLYLPVNVPGAMFSAGDGHAVQGDGEFCVTALETSLRGRFRLTVLKRLPGGAAVNELVNDPVFASLTLPRAETATHYVTMAFHEDLDAAEEAALLDMIAWMRRVTGVGRVELYRTASLVGDMAVTQTVNGKKGVHLMMPKSVMDGLARAVGGGGPAGRAGRRAFAVLEDARGWVADFLRVCKGRCEELLANVRGEL